MSYRKKRNPAKPDRPIERQEIPCVEFGNPGVIRALPVSKLSSGLPYQRGVKERVVNKLLREWDDRLLEPIAVSFRDGQFNVVDGQHRIAAMRKRSDGKDFLVPCRIYTGLNYEQEAELCFKLDKAKKRLTLAQSTNALVESGTDPEVIEIRRLVMQSGFVWALCGHSGKEHEIIATRAVINAYRLLGGAAFTRMLDLMESAWHGDPRSLTGGFISGLALFVKTYETEISDHTFYKRMSKVNPDEIITRGSIDFSTSNVALRYARILLEKYNGKGRTGPKLAYRFGA